MNDSRAHRISPEPLDDTEKNVMRQLYGLFESKPVISQGPFSQAWICVRWKRCLKLYSHSATKIV